jgi:rhodanese-related sulfurtransferase
MPVFLACILMILLGGIWPPVAKAGHEFDETIDTVKPEQVKLFLNAGEKLVLVDLRPAKEFNEKRLPGARSIPVTELDKRISEIPRAGRVVLYCGCPPGGADESYSYLYLRENGYRNVAVMEEGFAGWLKRKFAIESGKK